MNTSSKTQKKSDKLTCLVFSYIPLMMGKFGPIDIKDTDQVLEFLEEHSDIGIADGCAWFAHPDYDGFHLAFIVEQAQNVVEHLKYWAEGDPEGWFTLHVNETDTHYAVVLFPRPSKSIERFTIGMKLQGEEIPDDTKFHIISKPISFVSDPNPKTYMSIKKNIPDKIHVFCIDVATLAIKQLETEDFIHIGEFEIDREENGYLQGMLNDAS